MSNLSSFLLIFAPFFVQSLLSPSSSNNQNLAKISGDCDAEFSVAATQLASQHIQDQSIIDYIHAVMSSCNKAPIQKMAEVSVFLLHKGTVTPKVMGEIRETFDEIQKRRDTELSAKMQQLPPEMYSTAQKILQISKSAGLSGNERREKIEKSLAAVPGSYQFRILQIFDEKPAKMDAEPILEKPDEPIQPPAPKSFAIQRLHQIHPPEQQLNPEHLSAPLKIPHLKIPFAPAPAQKLGSGSSPGPEGPLKITHSAQNQLFPDLPPIVPQVVPQAQKFQQFLEQNPNLNTILKSIVQKGAKTLPESVGTVNRDATASHLLSPQMWSDAAKYFAASSNDLPTALSNFIEKSGAAQILPRSAAASARQHDGALDKYDTHIDRFATSGPANRWEVASIPQQPVIKTVQPPPGTAVNMPLPVESPKGLQIGMPTMPPSSGYHTYAPAPAAIVPQVVPVLTPEEITGSYRQPIHPILNQRLPNGQFRNVKIDAINEQRLK